MSSPSLRRAMRAFDEIPGATVNPISTPFGPAFKLDLTDEARAMVAEMMEVRPLLVEQAIQARIASYEPMFRNKVTELPNEEGNQA